MELYFYTRPHLGSQFFKFILDQGFFCASRPTSMDPLVHTHWCPIIVCNDTCIAVYLCDHSFSYLFAEYCKPVAYWKAIALCFTAIIRFDCPYLPWFSESVQSAKDPRSPPVVAFMGDYTYSDTYCKCRNFVLHPCLLRMSFDFRTDGLAYQVK